MFAGIVVGASVTAAAADMAKTLRVVFPIAEIGFDPQDPAGRMRQNQ